MAIEDRPMEPLFTPEQLAESRARGSGLLFGEAPLALQDVPRLLAIESGDRDLVPLAPPPGRVGLEDRSTTAAALVPTIPTFILHTPVGSRAPSVQSQRSDGTISDLTPSAAAREACSDGCSVEFLTDMGVSPDRIMDVLLERNARRRNARGRTRTPRPPVMDGEAIPGPASLQPPMAMGDVPDREFPCHAGRKADFWRGR